MCEADEASTKANRVNKKWRQRWSDGVFIGDPSAQHGGAPDTLKDAGDL